jgi:hypothetical protein
MTWISQANVSSNSRKEQENTRAQVTPKNFFQSPIVSDMTKGNERVITDAT